MKILHCCLAAFYIDGFGYQENILPRMHKIQGHDVKIVASTESYNNNLKLDYLLPRTYLNEDGIEVTRLPYANYLPTQLVKKLRIYRGLKSQLISFKPDIIFLHDAQFVSISTIVKYAKKNSVKIYIDSHTDFINSGKNWISKNILHGLIYKRSIKSIEKLTRKFYGTLPLRCDFLHEIYGINKEIIELLPFGADDSRFKYNERLDYRKIIRKDLKIRRDDLVLITGGKLDERKKIHVLIKAFSNIIKENEIKNTYLIVFGKPTEEMKDVFKDLLNLNYIIYKDWIDSGDMFKYFFASDLAVFPGTHSVLWEEAVGLGVPAVFYGWEGIMHLNKGGNCIYLEKNDYNELKSKLEYLILNPYKIDSMRRIAESIGPKYFSYSSIAKQAIELNDSF